MRRLTHTLLLTPLLVLSLLAGVVPAAGPETVAGLPRAEALRLGERMYRQGILPSGRPLQAVVQGDIPVEGTMFSCESCHLRSGLGSLEGTVITLPTNAAELYKPFTKAAEETLPDWGDQLPKSMDSGVLRPAYTDETLALALWNGVDPAGRELAATMPRYQLDPKDMEILVFYLKNLSASPSPGVDGTTLHLATVVSADLPPRQREAMLSVLRAYVATQSSRSRQQDRRAREAPFFEREMYAFYRQLQLHVWELEGPPASWGAQLEGHYRQTPVFALIGGMVTGEWAPVHAFCERNRLPCLFPVTELPVLADNDWYTMYFSKGYYQEGEGVARHLRATAAAGVPARVVQVLRDDAAGRALARGFEETWARYGYPRPEKWLLRPDEPLAALQERLRREAGEATVLLWLGPEVYPLLEARAAAGAPPQVFLAASLLGEKLTELPPPARAFASVAYPWRLPQEARKISEVVRSWLKVRKIPETDLAVQARMYAAVWQFSNALMMMKQDFYRDYLLDVLDCMNDQTYTIAAYPRLSFGQGQRYAAKGCYIVQLAPGPRPELVVKSDWVPH
jgi:ABC-type branched-subunit amino acid transport system substrate-binding protein